jgi:hypothetical protein
LGSKNEATDQYEALGWKFFSESKVDDAKDYLKITFDQAVEDIKKIFESIDDDNNGYLTPFELTLVS